ncbi:MAG: ATP-binding protein [Draconibacterium sp.]
MSVELNFKIPGGDFTKTGVASSKVKKALKQLNIDSKSIKRIVVAIYEAEINVTAHARGGKMKVVISDNEIEVLITDEGPGIENIEKAMEAGFSTASKEVREMGFGAGMGLPNIKKNTDELEIVSTPGVGTTVKFKCSFNK